MDELNEDELPTGSKRRYEASDIRLVMSRALWEKDFRDGNFSNVGDGDLAELSTLIGKHKFGKSEVSVNKSNLRDYLNYALGLPSNFTGVNKTIKIEAISKWLCQLENLKIDFSDQNTNYYPRIINYLNLPKENTPGSITYPPALQSLSDTLWWLYCYHDEEFNGREREGVLRLLVEVVNPDDVTIYHYDDFFPEEGTRNASFCSYKGRIEMHNGGDKRYLFELKHNGERDLHILLYKDEGGNSAWLTGQYHNVSRRGNIISGKILFNKVGSIENIPNDEKALFFVKEYKPAKQKSVKNHHIRGFESLPYSVKETFARKSQSFISVRNCFNAKQIDAWNRNENTQYLNEAEVSEYTYEFFLSGPATLLPSDEYEKFREKVLNLKSKLEEWYDCKGRVFTLFEEESIVEYNNIESRARLLFEKLVGSLRKSRVFIMLYHDLLVEGEANKLTGMLIEFGYCFHERKDCLVLWDKSHEDSLPNFIKGAAESPGSRIYLERFDSQKGDDPLDNLLKEKVWRNYLGFYPY